MAHRAGHVLLVPPVPVSDGSPAGNYAALDAVKQNLDIEHGNMQFVEASKPRNQPTTVSTATGAALRRVQSTY